MITLAQRKRRQIEAAVSYVAGFLLLSAVHEKIHWIVANDFCQKVWIDWVPEPGSSAVFQTLYTECAKRQHHYYLQQNIEIVGYHIIALYLVSVPVLLFAGKFLAAEMAENER